MLSKEDNELYKANHMQVPVTILTEEKLSRLEEHCKKAIHFERGNIREEHQIVLDLIYKYKDLESEKQSLIDRLEKDIINITETMQDGKHCDDYSRCRLKAYRTKIKEILGIVKGDFK